MTTYIALCELDLSDVNRQINESLETDKIKKLLHDGFKVSEMRLKFPSEHYWVELVKEDDNVK